MSDYFGPFLVRHRGVLHWTTLTEKPQPGRWRVSTKCGYDIVDHDGFEIGLPDCRECDDYIVSEGESVKERPPLVVREGGVTAPARSPVAAPKEAP